MKTVIISGSLNPESHSRILCHAAHQWLKEHSVATTFLDLRDISLPLCDGASAYEHPALAGLSKAIAQADAILMGVPIYNYDVNAAIKNLVELTGSAWENRVVGFLCAAGGRSSYMSVMAFANSLMLDFRCVIVPRFIYAVGDDFKDDVIVNPKITERIQLLVGETLKLARVHD